MKRLARLGSLISGSPRGLAVSCIYRATADIIDRGRGGIIINTSEEEVGRQLRCAELAFFPLASLRIRSRRWELDGSSMGDRLPRRSRVVLSRWARVRQNGISLVLACSTRSLLIHFHPHCSSGRIARPPQF